MKTALVTGGNRGIGYAIVMGLAKEGYQVLMGCRDLTQAKNEMCELPSNVVPVHLDLSDRITLNTDLDEISDQFPQVDVLVNNAAILIRGTVLEVPTQSFLESLDVNLIGPFEVIRHFVPKMIANSYGRVVNISSDWGSFHYGLKGPAAYSITKAALNALTVSLAEELPSNVKVNSMCPGWVKTRMGGDQALLTPQEGADTAIWLATLDQDGPSGGFFRKRRPIGW